MMNFPLFVILSQNYWSLSNIIPHLPLFVKAKRIWYQKILRLFEKGKKKGTTLKKLHIFCKKCMICEFTFLSNLDIIALTR